MSLKRVWKITKSRGTDSRTGKVDQDLHEEFEDCVGVASRNWEKGDQIHCMSKFRLLDDDGIIYVEGICSADVDFEPLDDYGSAALGCTTIQFYEGSDHGWVTL